MKQNLLRQKQFLLPIVLKLCDKTRDMRSSFTEHLHLLSAQLREHKLLNILACFALRTSDTHADCAPFRSSNFPIFVVELSVNASEAVMASSSSRPVSQVDGAERFFHLIVQDYHGCMPALMGCMCRMFLPYPSYERAARVHESGRLDKGVFEPF